MGNSSSKERAAFVEKYDALDKRCAAAVESDSRREKELASARQELDTAQAAARTESERFRRRLVELEAQNGSLQLDGARQVEALKSELSRELQGQVRVAEALALERNRARKDVEGLREEVQKMRAAEASGVADTERVSRELKAEHERERAGLLGSLAEKEKEVGGKETERALLEQKAREHETNSAALANQLEAINAKAAGYEQAHTALSAELAVMQNKLIESEAKAKGFEQSSTDLTKELEQTKADVAASEQQQAALQQQVSSIQAQLAVSERTRETLQQGSEGAATQAEQYAALSTQLLAAQASLAQAEQKAQKFEDSTHTLTASLSASKTSLESESQKSAQLAAQLATTQRSWTNTQAALASLQSTFNEGISKRNGLHEAFEATKIELREAHDGYRAMQAQLAATKTRLAAAEAARKEAVAGAFDVAGDVKPAGVPSQVRVGGY